MASLGTLALGTYTDVSSTAIQGSDPVLEIIASTDDTDYVYDATNSNHTGTARFTLADTPADFGSILAASIRLRYACASAPTNTWDSLTAQIVKSDGSTPLTDAVTVVSGPITTTTLTNSSVVALTNPDTAATKADWDDALVLINWSISKVKGGDTIRKNVYAAEVTGTYNLAAIPLHPNNIATAAPTNGTPVIGQKHVLLSNSVTTAAPTNGTPAVGQKHVLLADDVVTAAPTQTTPALAIVVPLLADDVATAAPTQGTPVIGQIHVLLADDVATAAPTNGTPVVGQIHVLLADNVSTAAPTQGAPTIGQIHVVLADDVATAAPVLDTPTLTEVAAGVDALLADDIDTAAPTQGAPAVGQIHVILADDVATAAPTSGVPVIGQIHGLLADDVATAAPTQGTPVLTEIVDTNDELLALGLATAAPLLGNPAVGQVHHLQHNPLTTRTLWLPRPRAWTPKITAPAPIHRASQKPYPSTLGKQFRTKWRDIPH